MHLPKSSVLSLVEVNAARPPLFIGTQPFLPAQTSAEKGFKARWLFSLRERHCERKTHNDAGDEVTFVCIHS